MHDTLSWAVGWVVREGRGYLQRVQDGNLAEDGDVLDNCQSRTLDYLADLYKYHRMYDVLCFVDWGLDFNRSSNCCPAAVQLFWCILNLLCKLTACLNKELMQTKLVFA
jgi:hypothetical protein